MPDPDALYDRYSDARSKVFDFTRELGDRGDITLTYEQATALVALAEGYLALVTYQLGQECCVRKLRDMDLFKAPGVAETLDWADALTQLNIIALSDESIDDTLGVLLKYQDDIAKLQGSEAKRILDTVRAELAPA